MQKWVRTELQHGWILIFTQNAYGPCTCTHTASSARKPRYALFSVGKNKASPARTASIKRASLRASVIRTEAPKLHLAFGDAEEADASGSPPWG